MVLPATPQAPPASPPANNDSQSFSPHLDKAMTGRKDTPSSRENIAKPSQQKVNGTGYRRETADVSETLNTSPDNTLAEGQTANNLNNLVPAASESQTDNPAASVLGQPLDNTSAAFQFLTNIFTNNIENNLGKQMTATQDSLPSSQAGVVVTPPLAETMNFAVAEPNTLALSIPAQGGKAENNVFLLELQKIIENSNESGTVTLTTSDKAGKIQSGISNPKTTMASAENEPLNIAQTAKASAVSEPLNIAQTAKASAVSEPLNIAQTAKASAENEPLNIAQTAKASAKNEPLNIAQTAKASAVSEPFNIAQTAKASAVSEP